MASYFNSTTYNVDFYRLFRDSYTTQNAYSVGEPDSRKVIGKKTVVTNKLGFYGGAAGIGYGIGKGVGDALSAYITARGTAAVLAAQASITEDNGYFAQMGVEQAFRAGEAQIAAVGMKQADVKAQQRTAFAANGIAIGVGSAAEQAASTDIQAEVDKITAQQNALAQAWGYRRQRMMAFAQAKGQRIMADATRSAGRTQMLGGIASTAAQAVGGFMGGTFTLGGQ